MENESGKQSTELVSQSSLPLEGMVMDKAQVAYNMKLHGKSLDDPLAVRNATALIALQAKINQLEAVDTQVGQRTVLVIGGAQADYVARLKEMTEDD
jgi:hypothetical protein